MSPADAPIAKWDRAGEDHTAVRRGHHQKGGTILSSTRGPVSISAAADNRIAHGIDVLYTVGGDGTQPGANDLYQESRRRGHAARANDERQLEYELILTNGSLYPHKVRLFAIDNDVNVRTGSQRIATLFPKSGTVCAWPVGAASVCARR